MGQLVTPEVAVPPEDLLALVALVRFVVRVRQKVRLQVRPLVEAPAADGALVRRLLHVQNFVHGQSSGLAEAFAALAALERLLLRVDVPVVAQVVLAAESLAAEVAGVRPLVGVSALVDEQVVRLGELPGAELANELFLGSRRRPVGGHRSRPRAQLRSAQVRARVEVQGGVGHAVDGADVVKVEGLVAEASVATQGPVCVRNY